MVDFPSLYHHWPLSFSLLPLSNIIFLHWEFNFLLVCLIYLSDLMLHYKSIFSKIRKRISFIPMEFLKSHGSEMKIHMGGEDLCHFASYKLEWLLLSKTLAIVDFLSC